MNQFEPFDFYLLRMPIFSYSDILNRLFLNPGGANGLRSIIDEPIFQEAIFLASADLYVEMQKWLKETDGKKKDKISISLHKYILRMATRSTPYGLFAGCSLGAFSQGQTNIKLEGKASHKAYRLDTGCYTTLAESIPFLNEQLLWETIFSPNSSIYNVGKTYRYHEHKLVDGKKSYFLSSFSQNEFIDAILYSACNGATFKNLISCLVEKNVDGEDAVFYLKSLIENQILVSEYAPKLTGGNQLDRLVSALSAKTAGNIEVLTDMVSLQTLFSSQTSGIDKFPAVEQLIEKYTVKAKRNDYIQVDSIFKLEKNMINNVAMSKIISQLEELLPLDIFEAKNDLEIFKQAFHAKFEDREIPLFEAMDLDIGVGYGTVTGEEAYYTPLIDGLMIVEEAETLVKKWTAYEAFVLKKYLEYEKNDCARINITEEEIAALSHASNIEKKRNLPATFSVLGTVICNSQADLDSLDFSFLLKNCGGNSAIAQMSRFGSGQSDIAIAMGKVINHEKQMIPGKILAEIVHHPEGHVGNVLIRPKIYDYEIPFLGSSALPSQFQVGVNDLSISIKNNRIILWSQKLNREILPRLTSAHNFLTGLPIYKFLCDLQFQDEGLSIAWNWGVLDKQPFLPRVVYKNIVLKRCRWFIEPNKSKGQKIAYEAKIATFKRQYQLPDLVLLIEGDNELLLDLTSDVSISILSSKMALGNVILYEFLHSSDGSFLANKDDRFDNEILVPIKNKGFIPQPAFHHQHAAALSANTVFTPGSEWLYLKIYSGYKSMDAILSQLIAPIISGFSTDGKIGKWFFLRYQDPKSHLRVRFNTKQPEVFYDLMKAIDTATSVYIEDRIIQKIEYESYFQEVEKYTPWAIDLCESLFCIDSKAVLNLVDCIQKHQDEESRWLVAIKGVDCLLTDVDFTLAQKKSFMDACFQSFFKEFNGDKGFMVQLNEKYRDKKNLIDALFVENEDLFFEQVDAILASRSAAVCTVHTQLLQRIEELGKEKTFVDKLANNLVHLFLNRLFIANHRIHEMVVYHHLSKYYGSALAKLDTLYRSKPNPDL